MILTEPSCTWNGLTAGNTGCISNASITCEMILGEGMCNSDILPARAGKCLWEVTCKSVTAASACGIASTPENCLLIADAPIAAGCWFDSANTGTYKCIANTTACAGVSGSNCHLAPVPTGYDNVF